MPCNSAISRSRGTPRSGPRPWSAIDDHPGRPDRDRPHGTVVFGASSSTGPGRDHPRCSRSSPDPDRYRTDRRRRATVDLVRRTPWCWSARPRQRIRRELDLPADPPTGYGIGIVVRKGCRAADRRQPAREYSPAALPLLHLPGVIRGDPVVIDAIPLTSVHPPTAAAARSARQPATRAALDMSRIPTILCGAFNACAKLALAGHIACRYGSTAHRAEDVPNDRVITNVVLATVPLWQQMAQPAWLLPNGAEAPSRSAPVTLT